MFDKRSFEEGDFDVFYSFFYYSGQAFLLCKPLLKKLENTPFQEWAEQVDEIIICAVEHKNDTF